MRVQIWAENRMLLEIDATVREGHTFSQEITQHPVEVGASIVDHLREKPATLSLECVHSNTPILRGDDARLAGFLSPPGEGERVPAAHQALLSLSGRTCEIVTELRTYPEMALGNLAVTRTSPTGDALAFTADFTAIVSVQTATVRVRSSAMHGAGVKNTGQQPTTEASAATRDRSALVQVRDAGKNAVKTLSSIFGK